MRTTVFELVDDRVERHVAEEPEWRPFEEYDGKRLERVRLVEVLQPAGAEVQLVEIAAGGHFAMHSSPDVAFCQIVHGRGKLGLPDGRALDYRAPELYVFLPDTLHEWQSVEEETLLAVCIVARGSPTNHTSGGPENGPDT